MRKIVLALVAVIVSVVSVMAQSSTEGKDFWVASTIVCSPSGASKLADPYIAISAEKACQITIDFADGTNFIRNARVAAGSWNTYTPTLTKWYPTTASNASSIYQLAGQTNNYGLHITATENVSVYVVLRAEYSMDASNILPTTAILSEYYTQDYWPTANDFSNLVSMATILATEDNTQVRITPRAGKPKPQGWGATETNRTINLNKGQTYYLMSASEQQMSGTHIEALNGKKIAVFNGSPLTRVPAGVAARDCLFEQSMPVDYWGTNFVVTRSMDKDANIVAVTAMENGTTIKIDGRQRAMIDAGETYYFELDNNDPYSATLSKMGDYAVPASEVFTKTAVYIETSCPCGVMSFDVGNGYKGKTTTASGDGDPSSVWIAPLEQKIRRITFGACYTNKTKVHKLDVVAETASCQDTKLMAFVNGRPVDKSSLLQWVPVPGNPAYSYAQCEISNDNTSLSIFTLQNDHGVIAHVYGNGDDESYAYSVGSTAVKRGVSVDGVTFVDGYRSAEPFCINAELFFDAQVGSDVIDKVDWDFGDGVTLQNGPVQTSHTYEAPGWYDVTANVYAHKECPLTTYPAEMVSFTFRVTRPDTLYRQFFICEGESLNYGGTTYTAATVDTARFGCDSVVIFTLEVGQRTYSEFDTVCEDEFRMGGKVYYMSGDYRDTLVNAAGCDSIVTAHVRVVACLNMSIGSVESPICADQGEFFIPYTVTRGDVGDAHLVSGQTRVLLEDKGNGWYASLAQFKPGKYSSAYVEVADTNCMVDKRFDLPFEVLFPSSIFEQKWEDVLAVLNQKYNGGYDIVSYQWFRNGIAIPGAISSVYYVGPDAVLQPGDSYSVLLTTRDGLQLMSCPQVIPGTANAPAESVKTGYLLAPGVLMLEVEGNQFLVR